ncbi:MULTISPECIES: hypothetical protein [Bacillus]|uniref:Uncharacterized protein n=2 Tax=Bacillus thuringiensis TaxID=1428 RepID=A0AAP4Q7P6_BACTU|nr:MULTISPECIES: hypothetical protein [Bacillus]MEC0046231.1 hypothetical protein [Bacillus cereus]AFV21594.1 hypothetical protein BTB_502p02890 [Bacillus thuringiensis Bt407]EEM25377.1 hypothetical protein bthur0002_60190 [Bacillus thuringiensis Bt407]ERI01230.1 hypothetical protein BTCBT_002785 [Bacillus thuringiensis T01-328]MBN6707981.1 hypothetical protein [Bacillus thuringiensis]
MEKEKIEEVSFNKEDEQLQLIKTNIDYVKEWSIKHLMEMLGYTPVVHVYRNINYLNFDIEEGLMTKGEFDVYCKYFRHDRIQEHQMDFEKLLTYVFGKALYVVKMIDFETLYIIRDTERKEDYFQ